LNVKQLKNGTRYSYSYNDTLIESRIWSIEWRHFQWSWITDFKSTPLFDV